MSLVKLSTALRETGRPVCHQAAARLDTSTAPVFDLHLRHARLTHKDARVIAKALGSMGDDGLRLRSFSISYNPSLGDDGLNARLASLPHTLAELGMVECGLSDESGTVLWNWAQSAAKLRMMCVEGNRYSPKMRQELSELSRCNARPSVFV